jgi:hypothetical protein
MNMFRAMIGCGVASVADPGSDAFLTPGSGMGKKSGSGSGRNSPDHISESLENNYLFFDADPGSEKFGSGMEKIRIQDPGKHPGSATLGVADLYHIGPDRDPTQGV